MLACCKWVFDFLVQPCIVAMMINITLQVFDDDLSHRINPDTESAIKLAIMMFMVIASCGNSSGRIMGKLFFAFFVASLLWRCILQLKEQRR